MTHFGRPGDMLLFLNRGGEYLLELGSFEARQIQLELFLLFWFLVYFRWQGYRRLANERKNIKRVRFFVGRRCKCCEEIVKLRFLLDVCKKVCFLFLCIRLLRQLCWHRLFCFNFSILGKHRNTLWNHHRRHYYLWRSLAVSFILRLLHLEPVHLLH
jgi:hypothetical protein